MSVNDDRVRAFLADEARRVSSTAPSLDEMVDALAPRLEPRAGSPTRKLVLVLAASLLLVAALATAIGVGSGLVRLPTVIPPDGPAYEAVFLRLVTDGREHEVLVVGVDPAGSEREVARIPDGWVLYGVGDAHLSPMGAVSRSGLLAMPSGNSGGMQWRIHDLRRPEAEPLIVESAAQDIEQLQSSPYFAHDMRPSVFWGPADQVAIPWYLRGGVLAGNISVVDGRTGVEQVVAIPGGGLRWLYPGWASDGSGVLLSRGLHEAPRGVLHPDGSVSELEPGHEVAPACRSDYASGAELVVNRSDVARTSGDGNQVLAAVGNATYACLAPDEGSVVAELGVSTPSRRVAALISPGVEGWIEVEGSFAGWMEVTR